VIQKETSYKILATFAVMSVLAIAFIGFWFADEKSEPQYLSKIDKLMFEKENTAPKFVLTLPAPGEIRTTSISADPNLDSSKLMQQNGERKVSLETLEEIIAHIPTLRLLKDKEQTQTLKHVRLPEEMVENEGKLLLPKISMEGFKPWNEYGVSVKTLPNFKKVAVIIKGEGLDPQSFEKIIKAFDSEVAISFSPYAQNTGSKILSARALGHETYIDLLLSSKDFLKSDSGPMSMSITISPEEAMDRLKRSLSTGAPVGGVVINEGLADEDNAEMLTSLLIELKKRGLLIVDATHADGIDKIAIKGLARRKADIVIESNMRRETIVSMLKKAEEIAFNKGQVVVVVSPKPAAVVETYNWINSFSPQLSYEEAKNMELSKPFALVPISNLTMEQ